MKAADEGQEAVKVSDFLANKKEHLVSPAMASVATDKNSLTSAPDVEVEYNKLCSELCVPAKVKKKAWKDWSDMISGDTDIKSECMQWLACLLYAAHTDSRFPYGMTDPQVQVLDSPTITVTTLLQKTNLGILAFFERLRALKELGKTSTTVQQHVIILEKKYCIVAALYDKLEKIFAQIFRDDAENESNLSSVPEAEQQDHQSRKVLIWTTFVLTKGVLDMGDGELVFSFYLLLCSVDYVLRMTPSFMLSTPFDTVRRECCENIDPYCMLKQLCDQYMVQYEEVKSVRDAYWEPYISSLPHCQGELDLPRLEDTYLQTNSDINELLFLTKSPILMPTGQGGLTSEQMGQEEVTPDNQKLESVPMTPVRAALTAVQQLKEVVEGCENIPSPGLIAFFKKCSSDPQSDIQERLKLFEGRFVNSYCHTVGKNNKYIAEQRYQLAVRLYYIVLEKMLRAEEDRLSRADFSTLLNNEVFHKSLLACTVEVVIIAYSSSGNSSLSSSDIDFPWILTVFQLQAYNFYKVLESFIRAEPSLNRDTIKHLQHIENQILERIAWKSDSPLFDLLSTAEILAPPIPTSPGDNEKLKNGGTAVTAAQLYLSPNGGIQATAAMNDIGQISASSSGRQSISKRSHSLNLFFNKVCRLAYHRLQSLCKLLGITKDVQLKIWTCLEHCITKKPDLLRDRHLDQVMLCSVYAIHKVLSVDTELKFKSIVQMYRCLPHATQEVYKNTLITANEYDSIIGFYNKVFMQAAKNVILQFSPSRSNNSDTMTLSPVPKNIQSPLTASPIYSVPGRRGFYVSPLKSPTFKAPISPNQMTPRTRQLYSFGEGLGSSEKLKHINETLQAVKRNSPSVIHSRSQKRLKFDQPEQEHSSGNNFEAERIIVKKSCPAPSLPGLPGASNHTSESNATNTKSSYNLEGHVKNDEKK